MHTILNIFWYVFLNQSKSFPEQIAIKENMHVLSNYPLWYAKSVYQL